MRNNLAPKLSAARRGGKLSPERAVQRDILAFFQLALPAEALVFSIPNGGTRNVREMVELKKDGLLPGMPDLCVFWASIFCTFEVKKPGGGRGEKHQKEIGEQITQNGGFWFCVQNAKEAAEGLKQAGIPCRARLT